MLVSLRWPIYIYICMGILGRYVNSSDVLHKEIERQIEGENIHELDLVSHRSDSLAEWSHSVES